MTDDCDHNRLLLQAEHDGELNPANAAELAAHLAACPACAATRLEMAELSRRLRAEVPYHHAPGALHARIAAQLAATNRAPTTPRMPLHRQLPGFAAGLAMAAAVALAILPMRGADIGDQVVGSHIRALQAAHLVDVASSDQHQVKPWFDGRLDYAPPVRDLAAQGFPLEGGRLDYLDGRPVSALVYRRARHAIDLFIWPAASHRERAPAGRVTSGYNLVRWSEGDMVFWAVSDLAQQELDEFVRLWRSAR
ncbi:MAG: anti-sigma factor [Rubritepida sp.]|nr:anti-sigma factor [Rubritepida sp.]